VGYHTLGSCNDSFHWGVTQLGSYHPTWPPYYKYSTGQYTEWNYYTANHGTRDLAFARQ
jgi:hypothetical protein